MVICCRMVGRIAYCAKLENKLDIDEYRLSPYVPVNWYSEGGAVKKMHLLENKGLPSFYNWRFITLTIDPLKFKSAESSYHYVKKRFRYFIRAIKKQFNLSSDLQWICKLEFTEKGYPHWHLMLNHKKPLCVSTVKDIWGYGLVNIKRCTDKRMPYAFKYITKEASGLPFWFLKLSRPRILQTSGIFPSLVKKTPSQASVENQSPRAFGGRENLGERLKRYSTTIQLAKFVKDRWLPVKTINIYQPFNRFLCGIFNTYKNLLRYESPTRVFIPINQIEIIV